MNNDIQINVPCSRCDISARISIWSFMWLLLVVITFIAVVITTDNCEEFVVNTWNHKLEECNVTPDNAWANPVLLSRALTTYSWARAFAIFYSLISIIFVWTAEVDREKDKKCCSIGIKISLVVALLLFADAFILNMFQDNTHGWIILGASSVAVVATFPGCKKGCFPCKFIDDTCNSCYKGKKREKDEYEVCKCFGPALCKDASVLWWIMWSITLISGLIFFTWMFIECEEDETNFHNCPPLRSPYYWFEFIFFWSLFFVAGYSLEVGEARETFNNSRERFGEVINYNSLE